MCRSLIDSVSTASLPPQNRDYFSVLCRTFLLVPLTQIDWIGQVDPLDVDVEGSPFLLPAPSSERISPSPPAPGNVGLHDERRLSRSTSSRPQSAPEGIWSRSARGAFFRSERIGGRLSASGEDSMRNAAPGLVHRHDRSTLPSPRDVRMNSFALTLVLSLFPVVPRCHHHGLVPFLRPEASRHRRAENLKLAARSQKYDGVRFRSRWYVPPPRLLPLHGQVDLSFGPSSTSTNEGFFFWTGPRVYVLYKKRDVSNVRRI